ncbi:MAG TPA: hypothetical protein DCG49_13555 [Ruminococcus sp.]|nr:hypothetical protein [Ruminococcus sp.]
MPSELLRQELSMLLKRTVWLNIAAYLISVPFLGATVSFAIGLLLGSVVLFVTLLLLQFSVRRMADDAKRSGVTSQKRYLLFYALRLLVFAAAFAAALLLRTFISPLGTVIPMLYPRLIYTFGAVFSRSGSNADSQKR